MNAEVRQKATIWLVLVFVLGTATGGLFGYNLARRGYAATKAPVQSDAERRAKKLAEMTQEIGRGSNVDAGRDPGVFDRGAEAEV